VDYFSGYVYDLTRLDSQALPDNYIRVSAEFFR
jgi:hypothetical protein